MASYAARGNGVAVTDATRTMFVTTSNGDTVTDSVAVEEPLEIRLTFGSMLDRRRTVLTVTMRTPGHDRELAAGYLAAEGIVRSPDEILEIVTDSPDEIRVSLNPVVSFDPVQHARSGYTTSSCGVCGKRSLEAVMRYVEPLPRSTPIDHSIIHKLPDRVRSSQPLFAKTGGIHAAALIHSNGEILCVREDVGRHNAADKVLGNAFLAGLWPLSGHTLFVSGRASFELVQKAAVAGIAILAAVGAPSSLAVALASEVGMTLCGFVRDGRFNIYTTPSTKLP